MFFAALQAFAEEPIEMDYRVVENCPSKQEFLADVGSRTALVSQPHGRDARHFVVAVRREPDGPYVGDFTIVSPDGSSSTPREVSDASCLEVIRTLALVAALAIDPQASTGPSTIRTDPSAPADVSSQAADPPTGLAPGGSTLAKRGPARPSPTPVPSNSRASLSPGPPELPVKPVGWRWSGGLHGLGLFDVVPVAALGTGFFAQLEPTGNWLIWPDFRLSVAYAIATSDWVAGPPASIGASSWWVFARAEACPGRFGTARGSLVLRFCGFLDGGAFTSSGVALANSRTTTKQWFAVGPAIRLTLTLGSRLFVDFEPGLVIPITRWRFTYKDSPTDSDHGLDRVRSIGETLSLSLGYGFQ